MKIVKCVFAVFLCSVFGLTLLVSQMNRTANTTAQVKVMPAFQTHPPDAMTNEAYQVNVSSIQTLQQISAQVKADQPLTTRMESVKAKIAAQNLEVKNNAAYKIQTGNTWYSTLISPAAFYDDATNTTLNMAYNYQISGTRYMISPAVYNANVAGTVIQNSVTLEGTNIDATVMAKTLQNGKALAMVKESASEATITNLRV